jgi:hypothetical protein
MTEADAQRFIEESGGNLCARAVFRPDGSIRRRTCAGGPWLSRIAASIATFLAIAIGGCRTLGGKVCDPESNQPMPPDTVEQVSHTQPVDNNAQ